MLITILGPDGTGKTTLAKALAVKTDGLDYVYFGGSNESRRYRIFERFIKSDLSNFFLRIIIRGSYNFSTPVGNGSIRFPYCRLWYDSPT